MSFIRTLRMTRLIGILPKFNCLYVAFTEFLAIGNLLQEHQLFKAPAVAMRQ